MSWNWQLASWPQFHYDPEPLLSLERQFLLNVGKSCAFIQTIDTQEYAKFIIEILSSEGVESSKIEGELLNRESLQSSIQKHFGFKGDGRAIPNKETGMAEALYHLYETYDQPLTHEMLWRWHAAIFKDSFHLEDVGRYRMHQEPMQIVSNRYTYPTTVYFEAPPYRD